MNPKVHVAVLFHHADFHGGGEVSTAELIRVLDLKRVTVLVLVPAEGEVSAAMKKQGLEVRVCDLPPLRRGPVKAVRRLAELIREYRIDVIHTGGTRSAFYGGLAARMCKVRCLWHVRESKRDRSWYDWLLARLAHQLVCVSEGVRHKRIAPLGKTVLNKTVVIHNAVDTELFQPDALARQAVRGDLGVAEDETLIGLVGSYVPLKGHGVLLRALARVVERKPTAPVRLLCVGRDTIDPDHARAVRREAEDLGLSSIVIFRGHCEQMRGVYSALDVLALPSRREGFSRAVLEGMSMGLPVLASDLAEIREAVPPPVHSLLAPYGDYGVLAEHLEALVEDEPLRQRMGQANGLRAQESFDLHAHGRQVQRLYFQMIQAPQKDLRQTVKAWYLRLRSRVLGFWPRREAAVPKAPERVLLVAPPRLGDNVLALAVPQNVQCRLPRARIEVLASGVAAQVMNLSPHVAQVHTCAPGIVALLRRARELGRDGYDLVLDLNLEWRLCSALAARLSGRFCVGYDVSGRGPVYDHFLDGPAEGLHMAQLYSSLVQSCTPAAEQKQGELLELPSAAVTRVQSLMAGANRPSGGRWVVMHPGGTHPSQRWSARGFAKVADALEKQEVKVVVAGAEADKELVQRVCVAMRTKPEIVALDLDVAGLAALLKQCDVFVGNNSGPLHLAAAVGTPTVSVMGPTLQDRWAPQGVGHRVLRADHLPCLGCNQGICPHGYPECLSSISDEQVFAAVQEILNELPEVSCGK